MSPRLLYPLLRATAHAVRWVPLAVGAALGLTIVVVPALLTDKLTDTHVVDLVRLAAACGALGAAFLLDDPAGRSTPTVPVPRLARDLARVAVAVPPVAMWWAVILLAAARPHLPAAALTLEAATLLTAAVALAAAARRRVPDGGAGVVAGPAVLGLVAVIWVLPRLLALAVAPDDPQWTVAHHRWAVLLAAGAAAFLWAGREPV